jgi:hypothetical protein
LIQLNSGSHMLSMANICKFPKVKRGAKWRI